MRNTFDPVAVGGSRLKRWLLIVLAALVVACALPPMMLTAAGLSLSAVRYAFAPYRSLVNTEPPPAGPEGATIVGYVSGGSSESFGDHNERSFHRIDIAWGSPRPDKQSQFLITDATVVERKRVVIPARSAGAKSSVIDHYAYGLFGPRRVAVSYEETAVNIGFSDTSGKSYFLSPVTRIVIDP